MGDKNAGLVIIDTTTYINKTLQFFNENNIKLTKQNPLTKYNNKLKNTIKRTTKTIEKIIFNSKQLTILNPRTPILYSLIKLHKDNKSIRPITSSINSPAHKLSKFLNHFLIKHHKYKSPCSIKNSIELINNIKHLQTTQSNIKNFTMISFDIVNLYTNIPITPTLTLLSTLLTNNTHLHTDYNLDINDINNILELFNITTKQNFFEFNKNIYNLNDGLPMGSPISGILANIYIDDLELKIQQLPQYKHVILWQRYVDDILCFWTGTNEELQTFHEDINNLSNIKFTIEIEQSHKINFLDLTLTNNNNNINFNIYRKPTTIDAIIPYDSHHNPVIKQSAFNFLFDRLLKIPMNKTDFNKELDIIYTIGKNNNYPTHYIHTIHKNTLHKHILQHIYPHTKTIQNNFVSIPYYPYLHNKLKPILRRFNHTITSYSHRTIADILINNKSKDTNPLNKSGIYKITCNNCHKHYIGLTTRNIKTRFSEHKYNCPPSAMGTHLKTEKHTIDINNNIELLHNENNFTKLILLEKFEIIKHLKQSEILLNENVEFSEPHIFKFLYPFNTPSTYHTK